MAKKIDEKTLERLAELARIGTDKKQEKKLLKDMEEILAYFEELNGLDTENIRPMDGGTENENVLAEDDKFQRKSDFNKERITGDFPESENGFLKIPPVFEK
jgi:aspartyl-tRNA(Asn)/glutamyl-tRNA(Gln) amidotransferase subunit C